MLNHEKWDRRYLDMAEHVAQWSKDPSRKVGSVIVNRYNRIVSVGYNGFPEGVLDIDERYTDRETKYLFVNHAERNALDNATVDLHGHSLYVTMFPCSECAKSIIQKGITRVIISTKTSSGDIDGPPFHFDVTKKMFEEANVVTILY